MCEAYNEKSMNKYVPANLKEGPLKKAILSEKRISATSGKLERKTSLSLK
jgi:hypothetical protein